MTALHSVHSAAALAACLVRATDNDAVILLDDGVYAALSDQAVPVLYVLSEDLAARGLSVGHVVAGKVITMKEFVALTVLHTPIVAWF